MTEPVRLGIIGAGFNARFHVQSLVSVRDVVVAGVMSRTTESASSLSDYARELGVGDPRVFEDPEAMAGTKIMFSR